MSRLDPILGILACLVALLVPILPDEKLVRLKLESLELGIFAMLVVAGISLALRPKEKLSPLMMAVLAWVAVAAALWIYSPEPALATQEIRRVLLAAGAFFAFTAPGLRPFYRRGFIFVWAAAGAILSIYGLLQITGGVGPIQVPPMERIAGTFGNPIFFASFLSVTLFVTGAAIRATTRAGLRPVWWVCLMLELAALYFTKTRAAWIGVLGALLIETVRTRRWWAFLLLLAGISGFGTATRSVWVRDQGHLLIWRDTARIGMDHSLKGVGLGAFHTNFPAYAGEDLKQKWPQGQVIINDAHNEYLQMLAEGGIFYLGAFLLILVCFFRVLPRVAPELFPLVLAVIALLIQNAGSADMRFGISFATLFMLMGIVASDEPVVMDARVEPSPSNTPLRMGIAAAWTGFMGLVILPALLKPYQAQKKMDSARDFFDLRLLDPAKTLADLEKLAAQFPMESAVLEKLAYAYAKEIKTPDNQIHSDMAQKALHTYDQLIQVDPKRLSAYNNSANIYYTLGRTDLAIHMWKKALDVDPNFLDAHLNLGKILYVQGHLKESAEHFEKVLRIQPGNDEAIVYLKRMVE